MARPLDRHRPLLSGIGITSRAGTTPQNHTFVDGGTLTGLATSKADANKLMLVTALHVMAGVDSNRNFRNPSGNEKMFQGGDRWLLKVGEDIVWEPISLTSPNTIDAAAVVFDQSATVGGARFQIHDVPSHTGQRIISGTKDPVKNMAVVMVGSRSTERTGKVTVAQDRTRANGASFRNVAQVNWNRSITNGDSGSPVLVETSPGSGIFRMVGILILQDVANLQNGYVCLASTVEDELGLVFGEQLPVLDQKEQSDFDSKHYGVTTWQPIADFAGNSLSLDSTSKADKSWESGDIPATGTTHPWWKLEIGTSGATLTVRGGPDARSGFTAGSKWGFRLYVKRESDGIWRRVLSGENELIAAGFLSGADRKPVVEASFTIPLSQAEANKYGEYFEDYRKEDFEVRIDTAPLNHAPRAVVEVKPSTINVGVDVTLDGSDSSDPDGGVLVYEWEQVTAQGETALTLTGAATSIAKFTAPSDQTTLTFKLKITDAGGRTDEATVHVPVYPDGVESFDEVSGSVERAGTWTSDVLSVHRRTPRGVHYARYYVFKLAKRSRVMLTVASSLDSYMVLLRGADTNGAVIEHNDDYGLGISGHSRITRELPAGEYTIEATTNRALTIGSFNTYIQVLSPDATLSGLALNQSAYLSPAFASATSYYTTRVQRQADTLRVTPTTTHQYATVTVNGKAVRRGQQSDPIALSVGVNTITIVVTAEDGHTTKTYTIKATRATTDAPIAPPAPPISPDTPKKPAPGRSGPTPPVTPPLPPVPPPTEKKPYGPWKETGKIRGGGEMWEREEKRTRTDGTDPQFQWVDGDPPPWTEWKDTGRTQGTGQEQKKEQKRHREGFPSESETRWWPAPDPTTIPTPPRPEPPKPVPETWGPWSSWRNTGNVSGSGREREVERERTRTSNKGNTQRETTWIPDPVEPPETWGEWSDWTDTGSRRSGDGDYGEKEQSRTRTSSRGRQQTQRRWVTDE